jgi:hypothetical protein
MMQYILSQLLKFVETWASDYEDDVTFTQRILNEHNRTIHKELGIK